MLVRAVRLSGTATGLAAPPTEESVVLDNAIPNTPNGAGVFQHPRFDCFWYGVPTSPLCGWSALPAGSTPPLGRAAQNRRRS